MRARALAQPVMPTSLALAPASCRWEQRASVGSMNDHATTSSPRCAVTASRGGQVPPADRLPLVMSGHARKYRGSGAGERRYHRPVQACPAREGRRSLIRVRPEVRSSTGTGATGMSPSRLGSAVLGLCSLDDTKVGRWYGERSRIPANDSRRLPAAAAPSCVVGGGALARVAVEMQRLVWVRLPP